MKNLTQHRNKAISNPLRGFKIHLLVFVLTVPALWLIWYLTDRTTIWPVWNTTAWTIGILFHYLGAFVFKKAIK